MRKIVNPQGDAFAINYNESKNLETIHVQNIFGESARNNVFMIAIIEDPRIQN